MATVIKNSQHYNGLLLCNQLADLDEIAYSYEPVKIYHTYAIRTLYARNTYAIRTLIIVPFIRYGAERS